MPLYEYACAECGRQFETLVRNAAEAESVECPDCHGRRVEKAFSVPARPAATAPLPTGGGCPADGSPCGRPWCQRQ